MADEYIRQQDAVAVAESYQVERTGFNLNDYEYGRNQVADSIASDLEDIEPADVAPVVHAHWIQTSAEDENGNAYYYCSNCGRGESHNPIVEVPYCWKCGAKMDGGKS